MIDLSRLYRQDERSDLSSIFVMSIKTDEKKPRLGVVECSVLDIGYLFFIRCRSLRLPGRSMFDVGVFAYLDVHLSKQPRTT